MTVKNPPEGTTAVTPHLMIDGAANAIEFYKKAFGAKELFRMPMPNGKIMHAQISIDGARIMLCDAMPEKGSKSPTQLGGTPVMTYLYVANSDQTMKDVEAAGAQVIMPCETQFYGDRGGAIRDPFGHVWWVATHVEDVKPDELERRGKEAMQKMADCKTAA